jgi:hypothetical protein
VFDLDQSAVSVAAATLCVSRDLAQVKLDRRNLDVGSRNRFVYALICEQKIDPDQPQVCDFLLNGHNGFTWLQSK